MTKELTFKQYLEYVRGPAVNFAVGTGEDRKYHCLPKYILCHYSKYFERLLTEDNEAHDDETPTIELPDERVLFFDTLFEFMLNKKINDYFLVPKEDRIRRVADDDTWSEEPLRCYERYIDTCMEFLLYAQKYDLGEMASDIVCPSLSIV
ncbi:hypothetical protein HYALB_00001644 [Hymenoscyphus albidus]|uniref:BTB domain-containing protein n=1 Tax=Hymenoscyphus albidus TaxID=595503 RepID=A0A9N9LIN2_9HELO|nr:hypothetical protein HYALB_00001644 [Hymenoscyphus albidus]